MATKEIDLSELLGEAEAETERELFADAVGEEQEPLDDTGDRAIEEMGDGLEGQHEADKDDGGDGSDPEDEEKDEEPEGDDEPPDDRGEDDEDGDDQPRDDKGQDEKQAAKEPAQDDRQPRRVPLNELTSERAKRQEAERKLGEMTKAQETREAERNELARTRAELDLLKRGGRLPENEAQRQAPRDEMPDILLDPQGFVNWQSRQMAGREAAMRGEMQLQVAQIRHGEKFNAAYETFRGLDKSQPDNVRLAQQILSSPDIGEALVNWHTRNEVLQRVGSDPAAYEESVRAAMREALLKDPEFLAQVRGEAPARSQNNGQPRQVFRSVGKNPKSLGAATGGSARAELNDPELYNDSEKSVFDYAMR